jgi:hypothetical protein
MWERITVGVASLEGSENANPQADMDEEQLVEYEGMLVAASAAQRRRCAPVRPQTHPCRDKSRCCRSRNGLAQQACQSICESAGSSPRCYKGRPRCTDGWAAAR